MKIWFASNNSDKKRELEAVLNIKLNIPKENNISFDPEETGATFTDNALLKARELKKLLPNKEDIIIADDSGLCTDGLDGRPGVLSARYGASNGEKIDSTARNLLLLKELKDNPMRTARFVCAMVLLFDLNRFFIAQETIEGEIIKNADDIRGDNGFGYDPIFIVPQFGKTLAELSDEEKNEISHRGKAASLIKILIKNQHFYY